MKVHITLEMEQAQALADEIIRVRDGELAQGNPALSVVLAGVQYGILKAEMLDAMRAQDLDGLDRSELVRRHAKAMKSLAEKNPDLKYGDVLITL